jgi:hypothetical protein
LTHEIGHLFGLGHSERTDATMFLSAENGEIWKRTLSQDDIDGICALYPVDDQHDRCLEPSGGLDVDCSTADYCGEPVDGFLVDCTFNESVCCCDEAGGFGRCEWSHATECRLSDRHAILELDRWVGCIGRPPFAYYTCCCQLDEEGARCDWAAFEDCTEAGGFPSAYPLYAEDLCGPFSSEEGCGCTTADVASPHGWRRLLGLLDL